MAKQLEAFRAEFGNGFLVSFTPTDQLIEPLKFAVMIAKHRGSFLLVHNRYRACWEIPGGLIDPGETAGEAAIRELFEETGQRASREGLLGRLEVGGEVKTVGALYGCAVTELRPFTPNEEIAELALWYGQQIVGLNYPGQLSDLDRRLLVLYDAWVKPM